MLFQEKVKIINNQELSPEYFKLTFISESIAREAKPGQFLMIKVKDTNDPLLRRPFGVHRVNKDTFEVEVLYKVVGIGTKILSQAKPDKQLDVLGPLGTSFMIDPAKKHFAIVAGGIGIAPLLWLAEILAHGKKDIHIIFGGKSKNDILFHEELKELTKNFHPITENGTLGRKGIISDYMASIMHPEFDYKHTQVFACGPTPLLKYVTDFAIHEKIVGQVSLEEKMACGIGICAGCAVKTLTGYKKVCKDGPVFDVREIIWQS